MSKPSVDAQTRKKRAQKFGRWAEALVRAYLRLTGRRILAANFKTPVGEIDIVARRGGVVSFVEVKARADAATAAHAIGASQQNRIVRAAEYFLLQNPHLQTCTLSFDVALVSGPLTLRYQADAWRPKA